MDTDVSNDTLVSGAGQGATASGSAWRGVLGRIKSVTPSVLARALLVFGVLASLVWLVVETWPAMLPFALGAILAYILLPVVNWLDKIFPRVIAVLLTLVGILGLIAWFLSLLLPALGAQITYVYRTLPSFEEIQAYVINLADYAQTMPEPVQLFVDDFLAQLNLRMQSTIQLYAGELANVGLANVAKIFNTVGFVLGFLVVPGWLLTVLKDREDGLRATNRLVPRFMRKDFWAVVQLVDRPFRSFLHGQMVMGLATAVLMYGILWMLEYSGMYTFQYKLVAALLAGFFALIPEVGVIFAAITFFILGNFHSFERAVLFVVVYVVANQIVKMLAAPRIEKSYLNIHPAVLVIAIVLLSEFGLFWILVAAPLTAVIRDLYQYVYGRIDDPPRPAGVLPSEPIPVLTAPQRRGRGRQRNTKPEVPVAYRHGRAERRTRS